MERTHQQPLATTSLALLTPRWRPCPGKWSPKSVPGWVLGNLLSWSGRGVPALKGQSGLSDLQASFRPQISMNPVEFNNHCYVSGLGLWNLILWNQGICSPLGMFKEGEQVGDSTWGDQGCDGGGHGLVSGPKEVPTPGGARLAGNEGRFPGRRDWSLTGQVKWGRNGDGHPRQKEQQEQGHGACPAGPALAGTSRRAKRRERTAERSLEELGANKPRGHEAAGGSVHAHCLFIPLTGIKAMPTWGSEDGQQGLCIQRREREWE